MLGSVPSPGQWLHLGPLEIPRLGSARMVRVYLPAGYRDSNARYPALVMWDGQNVFEDGPSYAGGWHVHDAVDARARAGLVAPVVVGIPHGGPRRLRELSAWAFPDGEPLLPAMLAWVKHHLLPELHNRVRLLYEPEAWTVGGSSMGGLAALHAHFLHPEVFGACLAMSPSLWVGGGALLEFVAAQPRPHPSRVYLDAGGREGDGVLLAYAHRLAQLLRLRGWGPESLRFVAVPEGEHREAEWRARLPAALEFLYGQPAAERAR